MPSPTSTMVPTPETSAPASKPLISLRMIDVISSDLIAIGSFSIPPYSCLDGGQSCPQPLQAAANTGVVESVTDADGDAADQRLVDHLVDLDLVPGELLQPLHDCVPLRAVQL